MANNTAHSLVLRTQGLPHDKNKRTSACISKMKAKFLSCGKRSTKNQGEQLQLVVVESKGACVRRKLGAPRLAAVAARNPSSNNHIANIRLPPLQDILSSVKTKCLVALHNMRMDKKFCQNLKAARAQSGMTQKQIATLLGVVESCYANWEQGRTEPSVTMLRALCNTLNVTADELLNGEL